MDYVYIVWLYNFFDKVRIEAVYLDKQKADDHAKSLNGSQFYSRSQGMEWQVEQQRVWK